MQEQCLGIPEIAWFVPRHALPVEKTSRKRPNAKSSPPSGVLVLHVRCLRDGEVVVDQVVIK